MKKILAMVVLCLPGCASVSEAKAEFDREVHGFKVEFARVFLKKEIE